ncbi:aminoglycoside phosphotransferase family protein [Estrella lausannensis]|uniref:Putative choline/ethanolamine kinase n=1 Tax=Estrella lausannensis TaxID=483423 RepID=A0A0H5DSG1_9BACT|nr:aminoglycoside phosphotransferase family protein [Estrella lausannensis]CRX38709.1 Putative choline/ethanolamine kinase [Estrella lausannensis]
MLADCPPSHYEIQIEKKYHSMEIRAQFVAKAFKTDQGLDSVSLMPLGGGASQSTYLLKSGQHSFVIKLFDDSAPLSDILLIFHSYQKAAEMEIGPSIRWLDVRQKALIMDYIEPRYTPANIKEALAALKIFHRPLRNEPFLTINQRIEEILLRDPDSHTLFHEAYKRMIQIEKAVGPPNAFCHFDFHRNNMIQGHAGVFLIDFDDAGPGHPFYDLAKLTLYGSKESKENILESYLERKPHPEECALFFLMEQTAYLSSASNRYLKWIIGSKTSDPLHCEAITALSLFLENTSKEGFESILKLCFEQRLH